MVLDTEVNVALAFVPKDVMAAMHTTIMRASMTAYSTAVGPSSRLRKLAKALDIRDNMAKPFPVQRKMKPGSFWKASRLFPSYAAGNNCR